MVEIDWLKRWSQYAPNRIAIHCADTGKKLSYAEFFLRTVQLAKFLQNNHQIKKGDRVAVLSANTIEFFPLFFAVQRLGAILVPINFRLAVPEVSQILSNASSTVVFVSEEYKHLHQGVAFAEIEKAFWADTKTNADSKMQGSFEDPCMILYTSGTTGLPKGVIITNKMIFWNSVNTSLRLDLREEDCTVSFLPFFHTAAWHVLATPFIHKGARIVCTQKFDAVKILDICEQEKITILFGVPTTLNMMAQTEKFSTVDLSSVRFAVVGGEPMPIELIRTWEKKNIPVRQGYGLTEFGPNVFSLNAEHSLTKIGSIGFPNFYIDVKVVDEEGNEVGADEVGELLLRGPMCTAGYWNNESATEALIKNDWLHTGDLVRRDQDGFFYVVGRKKEMYISGGENVYPAEVERVISSHPKVQEVAVLGVADKKWGEVGKAFVVPRSQSVLSEVEIIEYCRKNLAKYKIPKHVQFRSDLPKGHSGKILKKELQVFNEGLQ